MCPNKSLVSLNLDEWIRVKKMLMSNTNKNETSLKDIKNYIS